jgi:hypothetical protein
MPPKTKVLESSNDVVLRQILSPSPAWPDLFELQTKRVPQIWSFDKRDAALKAFHEELARC